MGCHHCGPGWPEPDLAATYISRMVFNKRPGLLLFGITETGVIHTDAAPAPDLESKFRMVSEAGVFDYLDKTPPADETDDYRRLAEKYDLPILAGGWFYSLGRDEALLEANLRLGAELGSLVHNVQIRMDHADGHLVTNEEVAEAYLRAHDIGAAGGCLPCFEIHVNMWSEDFRRITEVAQLVEARGVQFRITLDHSHVIFKIDNPREQKVFGIDQAISDGSLILDPFAAGNICDQWIEAGLVGHAHARATVPGNPLNIWGRHPSLNELPSSLHPQDTTGRGIQYPFIAPGEGEWHSPWEEAKLEPWKEVIRRLFAHRAREGAPSFKTISAEFIVFPDYGAGAKYSSFDNSLACTRWLRETWQNAVAAAAAQA